VLNFHVTNSSPLDYILNCLNPFDILHAAYKDKLCHIVFHVQGGQEVTCMYLIYHLDLHVHAVCVWYTVKLENGASQHCDCRVYSKRVKPLNLKL